jgi:hypothetical protein
VLASPLVESPRYKVEGVGGEEGGGWEEEGVWGEGGEEEGEENRNNIIIREPSASSEKKVGGLSVLTKGLSEERKNENY